jgi:hypothetical protein
MLKTMPHHKEHIVRSAMVTAFTIAVALIWKDVIVSAIDTFIPPGDELHAQFFAAVIATALVIVAIKVFVNAEEKAEKMMDHMFENHDHKDGGHQHKNHS